jgi:hypothetical protein
MLGTRGDVGREREKASSCVSSYKDANSIELGPHPSKLIHFNYLLKGFVSKYSQDCSIWILRAHNSFHNTSKPDNSQLCILNNSGLGKILFIRSLVAVKFSENEYA